MTDEVRQARPSGRETIDVRIDTPAREGLTGTTEANLYTPLRDPEQVTLAPDGRPLHQQPAWRADFPIDWPQDHYVERREFLKFLVLTSAALTSGQFWIAAETWWRRRRLLAAARRIATLSELPIGGVLTFAYPAEHDDCFVARLGETELVSFSQKCTHLSCAVRPLVDRGVIHCPCHEGYFDLRSGRPIAGPPRRPLPIIHLEVRSGEVFATGVEERSV